MGKHAVNMLRRAIVGLETGTLAPEVSRWLLNGLRSHLETGVELDQSLDLKPRVGRYTELAWRAEELSRRDRYLYSIAERLPGSLYRQAHQLSRILHETESLTVMELGYARRSLEEKYDTNWFHIDALQLLRRCRIPPPKSVNQLYEILKAQHALQSALDCLGVGSDPV